MGGTYLSKAHNNDRDSTDYARRPLGARWGIEESLQQDRLPAWGSRLEKD